MQLMGVARQVIVAAVATLVVALLLAALGPAGVRADVGPDGATEISLDVIAYADDDHVYTLTSQLAVARALDDDGSSVAARVMVDVVSAASVDIVSTASYRFLELRQEAALTGGYRVGEYLPSAGYIFSLEPDYESHAIGVGVTKRLGTPDSVLGVNYALTLDTIGMVNTPASAFSKDLTSHNADVSLTQVLGPQSLLRVSYALVMQRGYMEKAYRSVPLFGPGALAAARDDGVELDLDTFDDYRLPARPPEEVPDTRHRHALAATVMQYLSSLEASLRLDYRFYVDSWSVVGNTLEPALNWQLGRDFRFDVSMRLYRQSGAAFWQRQYVVDGPQWVPSIRTVDRALSPYYSYGGELRLQWQPGAWRAYVAGGATRTEYLDYLFLDDRLALTSQLGVQWRF